MKSEISVSSTEIPEPNTMVSQVHLLDECNLECNHCYVGEERFEPRNRPDTETLKKWIEKVIDFSEELGFENHIMNISGGEPTIHPDLPEITEKVSTNGAEPLLLTNGIRFNEKLASELMDRGLESVQISLEGEKDVNDSIRGEGTYEKVMKSIEIARNLDYKISVSFTISKLNFDNFRKTLKQLDGKVDRINLGEVLEIGAGKNMEPLDEDRRREFYNFVKDWDGESKLFLEDPPYCSISEELVEKRAGCGAFICLICIDVDGSVYPCRRAPVKMGTIEDLEGAWFSEKGKKLRNRDFNGK
ncbi:MAG: radical SAM/SPASM domain-containing protein, partial [Candidatus Aenigmatarchaeota archaeon]